MITVVGGSGMLGGYVCRDLLAAGLPVRVMTRAPEKAGKLADMGVELVRGDLRNAASLDAAIGGTRVLISASHALLGGRASSSEQVDGTGQRALVDAAVRAGVAHFVFVSVMGVASDHAIDFWRTKWHTEQYLKASGLPYTIVRPAAFMDLHAFELLGKAVLNGKPVPISGAGINPRNFVAAADVARRIAVLVGSGVPANETITIGGPQNLSAMEVARAFAAHGGRQARTIHLPLAVLRPLSAVIGLVHPGVGRVLRTAVNAETTDQTWSAAAPDGGDAPPPMTLAQWIALNCRTDRKL